MMSIRVREYKFFRSLSVKVNDNWPVRKAEQLWRQMRAHKIAEIEAAEACKWLRAAGFPQYAQMYEDMLFPVDIAAAQYDHPLLEPAILQSLFRRLHILNRCAQVSQQPSTHADDSEEEQCALSDSWIYQSDKRRWSRVDVEEADDKESNANCSGNNNRSKNNNNSNNISSSHFDGRRKNSLVDPDQKLLRRTLSTRLRHCKDGITDVASVATVSEMLLKRLGSLKCEEPSNVDIKYATDDPAKEIILDKNCIPKHTRGESKDFNYGSNLQTIDDFSEEKIQYGAKSEIFIMILSCTQLQILRKLALLKLTAHIEKYCPTHRTGWNWELSKFIKKIRNPSNKESSLLSLPPSTVLQRTGQPLPKGIQEALEWLYVNGSDQVGLFRKPGVRSRIITLKALVEIRGENINFNDQQPHDVADLIKQYFRELPEPVLTNKLSETFILIFQYVPHYLRREAVLCALLLMPDEHREILHSVLHFLFQIAKHADINQMNHSNLAICFAPTLFQYGNQSSFGRQGSNSSNPIELIEIKAAQECLLYMLKNIDDIFNVPREFLNQCKVSEIVDNLVELSAMGTSAEGGWERYMHESHLALLREAREKNRGWIVISTPHSKIELAYKKMADGHPLRLWRVCVDVEACPKEVLLRILRERHIWDDDLHSAKIIAQINEYSEVFHFVRRNISPLPYVDYCVIRTWTTDSPRGCCTVVETSVKHSDIPNIPNTIRGIVLVSRYLIEPGASGRSRLSHLSQVDTKGRMPEWYNKNFGHICALHAAHIQRSFQKTCVATENNV